jgi:hypothetical protein
MKIKVPFTIVLLTMFLLALLAGALSVRAQWTNPVTGSAFNRGPVMAELSSQRLASPTNFWRANSTNIANAIAGKIGGITSNQIDAATDAAYRAGGGVGGDLTALSNAVGSVEKWFANYPEHDPDWAVTPRFVAADGSLTLAIDNTATPLGTGYTFSGGGLSWTDGISTYSFVSVDNANPILPESYLVAISNLLKVGGAGGVTITNDGGNLYISATGGGGGGGSGAALLNVEENAYTMTNRLFLSGTTTNGDINQTDPVEIVVRTDYGGMDGAGRDFRITTGNSVGSGMRGGEFIAKLNGNGGTAPARFAVVGQSDEEFLAVNANHDAVPRLRISANNGDYSNVDGAGAHILMDNPSGSQNVLISMIGGVVRGKWRTDSSGNLSWIANGGSHTFYVDGDYGSGSAVMDITPDTEPYVDVRTHLRVRTIRDRGDGNLAEHATDFYVDNGSGETMAYTGTEDVLQPDGSGGYVTNRWTFVFGRFISKTPAP